MSRKHAGAEMWEIWPVNRSHENSLSVYWFDQNGQYADAELDPATGAEMDDHHDEEGRATMGGTHFVNFHYTLHESHYGLWIVAFATMAMLVALISGVVTHKRIFKDFFTFRVKKGQRSWLDAHNAVAVLTLPFQFMIAYTGIVISSAELMPAPVAAQYGAGMEGTHLYLAEMQGEVKPLRTGTQPAMPKREPMAAQAEALSGQAARAIVINNPEDSSMRIAVYGWNEDRDTFHNISATTGMAEFSGATGELLRTRPAGGVNGGTPALVRQVMSDLHMARFGGLAIQWLYFICGLAGAAMMGTGAVLPERSGAGRPGRGVRQLLLGQPPAACGAGEPAAVGTALLLRRMGADAGAGLAVQPAPCMDLAAGLVGSAVPAAAGNVVRDAGRPCVRADRTRRLGKRRR
ncbi:hypothetical protein G6F65_015763 [Rhizopus arrhizus]|nr:hypothetical protein G6F65_015763 [Rhizopus arrhizus]